MTEPTRVVHWVEIDAHRYSIRETIELTYAAEWRKQPAIVTMEASRYEASGGLTEWHCYASSAKDADGYVLTDLARTRLSAALKPSVMEWLSSERYVTSEQGAYASAIRGMASSLRPYSDEPTRGIREALRLFQLKTTHEVQVSTLALCDAYDRFAELYNA